MGEVRAYNVSTNTWNYSLSDMPAARYSMNGAGVINGKIYVSGGRTSNRASPPSADLFVYDPVTNAWTQKRSMPEGGAQGVTGVIESKLYVVTFSPGLPDGVANFFRYDPTADSWSRLPQPKPYFFLGGGGAVIGGKLYLIAPHVLVYDPATNQWNTKGPLPGDLTGAPVALSGKLYLFGMDTRPFTGHPGIFVYHPVTDIWTQLPLLTTLTFSEATDIVASRVFLLNGQPRVEVVGGSRPGNNQQYVP
jgi:N-acetylneuraminic acid mutarotase